MSRSCRQLIDEVHGLLQSYAADESQYTTLTGSLTSGALTFTHTPATPAVATGISTGVIEIDQELLYVDTVDASGNCTIPAWGRGHKGTTAASHTAGSRIVSQPSFPRFWTLQKINETLDRVFPEVFAVKSVETTATYPVLTYPLPSDAQFVLKGAWQTPGASLYWKSIQRFRMSPGLGSLTGDTGRSVDVADSMQPGRPIQFLYAAAPTHLTTEADDFEAITGLGAGMYDVIVSGAASLMAASADLSRLQMQSVEQQARSQSVAPNSGLNAASFLEKRFQARLLEERKSLQRLFPPRVTGSWF